MKDANQKKVLVFGKTGQVGHFLIDLLEKNNFNVIALDRSQADFNNLDSLIHALNKNSPDIVINAAAYTDVARAEIEKDLAFKVNAEAPAMISSWCAQKKIPYISYSTDYVFSSQDDHFQKESDPTFALNEYGKSKLLGEQKTAKSGGQWIILRTTWVYCENGKNFLKTILRLAAEKEELKIVNDQWGAPTYAKDLAEATVAIVKKISEGQTFESGIYHACNGGVTTWYEFAKAILEGAKDHGKEIKIKKLLPISIKEYGDKVQRPLNSRLSQEKLKSMFGIQLRPWTDGLKECMDRIYEGH